MWKYPSPEEKFLPYITDFDAFLMWRPLSVSSFDLEKEITPEWVLQTFAAMYLYVLVYAFSY